MFMIKYLDFYFYVCWQTEIKICLDYVLDIAHDSTNQDSRFDRLKIVVKIFLQNSILVQTLPKTFKVLSGTLLGIKG